MTLDSLLNAFVTLFVMIDPPGLAAVFPLLTVGLSSKERHQIALRSSVIGITILLAFMLIGEQLLSVLGISIAAFRVAGGLLLFYTAFEMVFEKRVERKGEAAERIISKSELHSIAAFPLATPLIAGPGSISATILLASENQSWMALGQLTGLLVALGLILYLSFLLANQLNNHISSTGRIIMARLLGILLAALSVQFIADGVRQLAAGA